jgi:hypothetical protein
MLSVHRLATELGQARLLAAARLRQLEEARHEAEAFREATARDMEHWEGGLRATRQTMGELTSQVRRSVYEVACTPIPGKTTVPEAVLSSMAGRKNPLLPCWVLDWLHGPWMHATPPPAAPAAPCGPSQGAAAPAGSLPCAAASRRRFRSSGGLASAGGQRTRGGESLDLGGYESLWSGAGHGAL